MTTAAQLLKSFTAIVMPAKAGISGGLGQLQTHIALDPSPRWGDDGAIWNDASLTAKGHFG